MHLKDSTDYLVGKIATFLANHLGTSEINPKSFYDAISAEITKRNDYKEFCQNKETLFLHKAISKKQFIGYVNSLRKFTSFESKCQTVVSMLMNGASFQQQRKIKKELNTNVKNAFFQYDNLEFRKLSNCIEVINDNIQDDDCNTYWDFGNKVLDEVKSKYPNPLGYDDTFILALIFYLMA